MSIVEIPHHEFEYLNKSHCDEILELDAKSCVYYDEDIEMEIVHPHAWEKQALLSFIKQRIPPTHGQVLRLPKSATPTKVVGYMAYELLPEQFHLLAFVIDPDLRRKGLGLTMLLKLMRYAQQSPERKTIGIHVREHDDASIWFWKAMGFKSRLRRNYFDDGEDAIFFWYVETKNETEEDDS